MLTQEFANAEKLAEKLGATPTLAPEQEFGFGIRSLVTGLDYTCRALAVVPKLDLPEKWGTIPMADRQELLVAYKNLFNASVPLGAKDPSRERFSWLSGDILTLARLGGEAQRTTLELSPYSAEELRELGEGRLTTMATAALQALVTWGPHAECFEGKHEEYYRTNLRGGITLMGKTLIPSELHV